MAADALVAWLRGPERWQWGPLPPELVRCWEQEQRSFTVLAGLLWRMLMDSYDDAREAVPGSSWLEVRYEDVIVNPGETFREMLRFSGLDWSAEFKRGLDRYRFDPSRLDAFHRDLDPEELARMTRAIAPALEARGYTGPMISA